MTVLPEVNPRTASGLKLTYRDEYYSVGAFEGVFRDLSALMSLIQADRDQLAEAYMQALGTHESSRVERVALRGASRFFQLVLSQVGRQKPIPLEDLGARVHVRRVSYTSPLEVVLGLTGGSAATGFVLGKAGIVSRVIDLVNKVNDARAHLARTNTTVAEELLKQQAAKALTEELKQREHPTLHGHLGKVFDNAVNSLTHIEAAEPEG